MTCCGILRACLRTRCPDERNPVSLSQVSKILSLHLPVPMSLEMQEQQNFKTTSLLRPPRCPPCRITHSQTNKAISMRHLDPLPPWRLQVFDHLRAILQTQRTRLHTIHTTQRNTIFHAPCRLLWNLASLSDRCVRHTWIRFRVGSVFCHLATDAEDFAWTV